MRMLSRCSLCLFLFVSFFGKISSSCHFNRSTLYRYDTENVADCYHTLAPPPATTIKSWTNSLKTRINMYPFRDIIQDSPKTGLLQHLQIDLGTELDKLGAQTYKSDYEFQQSIQNLFHHLYDGHMDLFKTIDCYSTQVVQPFWLTVALDPQSKEQAVYIRTTWYEDSFQKLAGMNVSTYVGEKVLQINGKPALEYLVLEANDAVYHSKDESNRLNFYLGAYIFPTPSTNTTNPDFLIPCFTGRNLGQQGLPPTAKVTYQFQTSTVTVPWLFKMQNDTGEMNSVTITTQGCINRTATRETPIRSSSERIQQSGAMDGVHTEKRISMLRTHMESYGVRPPSYHGDNKVQFHVVLNSTLVARFFTFDELLASNYFTLIDEWLQYAGALSVNNLIFDVRGNGGGVICSGLGILSRMLNQKAANVNLDTIHSVTSDLYYTSSGKDTFGAPYCNSSTPRPFCSNAYINATTGTHFPAGNFSYYNTGPKYTRGGKTTQYANVFSLNCPDIPFVAEHKFKHVLVLTDGTCGSTCAQVTSHLVHFNSVPTVVVGGIQKRSAQMYFSYPGGMDYFNFLVDMDFKFQGVHNNNPDVVPVPLPRGETQMFLMLEMYPWDGDTSVPMEFKWVPADHRIPRLSWDGEAEIELYQEVLKFM